MRWRRPSGMDCELLLSFKSPTSAVLGGDTRATSDRFALASLAGCSHVQRKQEREFFPFLYFVSRFHLEFPLYPISRLLLRHQSPLRPSYHLNPSIPTFSAFHFRVSASLPALTFPGANTRVFVLNRRGYRHSAHRVFCNSSVPRLGRHQRTLSESPGPSSCLTRKTTSL